MTVGMSRRRAAPQHAPRPAPRGACAARACEALAADAPARGGGRRRPGGKLGMSSGGGPAPGRLPLQGMRKVGAAHVGGTTFALHPSLCILHPPFILLAFFALHLLRSAFFALHSSLCILRSAFFALHSALCILRPAFFALHLLRSAFFALHSSPCILRSASSSLCILRPEFCAPHLAFFALPSSLCIFFARHSSLCVLCSCGITAPGLAPKSGPIVEAAPS